MAQTTIATYATKLQIILSAYQAKQKALFSDTSSKQPDNPADWNKTPPRDSQIRSLRQDTVDVNPDTPQSARSIGDLTGGKTRLNVFSALTKGDRVDFFKFNVTTAGKAGGSVTSDSDDGVHVQIIKANGEVIADSEAKFGDKKTNYDNFLVTRLYLDKGSYFMKVTRATGALQTTKPNYAIQLSMGKYITEDYDTVETAAASAASSLSPVGAQKSAAVSTVLNQLAGGNLFDFIS
jgi:hypothetical protein